MTTMELKVTAKKAAEFYVRAATGFLTGDKQDPVENLEITGLGNAIPVAVNVGLQIQEENKGKVVSIKTDYPGINQSRGVAQIRVSVKSLVNPLPERLQDPKLEKILAKVRKEGGKRGVEIEGAGDMGGLQFFCTTVNEPNGWADLLIESMRAMNVKCAPDEEERKGGSGHIGKLIISAAGEKEQSNKMGIVTYVPKALQEKITPTAWLEHVCDQVGVPKEMIEKKGLMAYVDIRKDVEKNIFPLKIKDTALSFGLLHLKNLGLFPNKTDDSDDDECVFGDDDFPQS